MQYALLNLQPHGKHQVETLSYIYIYMYLVGIYAFNRGQSHLILLFVKPITSIRLLTEGYWFTKTVKAVSLLFSKQTGLYSKHTNSHFKAVVFTTRIFS